MRGAGEMKAVRVVMLIGMALLIAGGTYALSSYQETGQIAEAKSSEPTAYVESTTINASFKVGGRIESILVKEGDHVKRGQLLATLENGDLQAKAAQAQAAVTAAESGVAQAQATVSGAEAKKAQGENSVGVTADTSNQQIAQAEAAVKAAQANLDSVKNGARPEERQQAAIKVNAAKNALSIASNNLNRMKSLKNSGAVPQAQSDQAELDYEKAKAEYDADVQQQNIINKGARPEQIRAAQAQLEQAKASVALAQAGKEQVSLRQDDVQAAIAGVDQAQAGVGTASATVTKAKAALQEARTYLTYTELRAPEDGIITTQSAQLGELVGAAFPVFTIETTQNRWAKFYFPETDLNNMKAGNTAFMKLLSSGKTIEGKIAFIEPAADFAVQKPTQSSGDRDVRSFGVKIMLQNLPDTVPTGSTLIWQGKGAK
jgi:HlyD family secretion protein